uniref:cytotoxic T-lymphocyte protein 4 n=1 Tax=Scatophagus argus TaxID=75038 RepID=UPI001ED7ED2C|nr:cytotoxic T-lymphocyte protein 4 [Scatophagus argus]
MYLVHFWMDWIVLTVLSLCLPVWSAAKVTQPYKVVSTNGTAQVQCFIQSHPPYNQMQPLNDQRLSYANHGLEELRVTLLKGLHGTQEVCSSILNLREQRDAAVEKEGEVQCSAQVRGGAVEVTVSGLKATDTDMYRCDIEVFYPPPYLRLTGNGSLILVLDSSDCAVKGAHKHSVDLSDEEEDDVGNEKIASVNVPVVVLVILVLFALLIIFSFQTLQYKQGKREIIRTVSGALHKVDAAAFPCENFA